MHCSHSLRVEGQHDDVDNPLLACNISSFHACQLHLLLAILSQVVLAVSGNGSPNQDIVQDAGVGQGPAGDWGGGLLCQPGLQGSPLICVPVSGNHWVSHCDLQVQHAMSIVLDNHDMVTGVSSTMCAYQ